MTSLPLAGGTEDQWRTELARQCEQNGRLFFRLAFGVLRDAAKAEDVCQQAMVKAIEHRETLTNSAAMKGWLCRVVINESLSVLRRRKTELRAMQQRDRVECIDSPPGEAMETRELLMAALAELPAQTRHIVVLRVVEGMTGNQVSEMLGCAASEVSRRLHAGLDQMRCHLKESDVLTGAS